MANFQHGDFKIEGSSVSGMATCFKVQPYNVVVDIGVCPPEVTDCSRVFITHADIDHMAAAVQHAAIRDMRGQSPSRFVCSPEVGQGLYGIFKIWKEVQGDFNYTIDILRPGERISIGKGVQVQAFPTLHRGVSPSQGYAFIRTISKLKPEFVGLRVSEIGKLVRSGVLVKDSVEVVEMAFTGDTKSEIFDSQFMQAKIVVLESTFVNDKISVEEARMKGHTHLTEIGANTEKFKNCEKLVLTHFSNRFDVDEINQAIAGLPEELDRR